MNCSIHVYNIKIVREIPCETINIDRRALVNTHNSYMNFVQNLRDDLCCIKTIEPESVHLQICEHRKLFTNAVGTKIFYLLIAKGELFTMHCFILCPIVSY